MLPFIRLLFMWRVSLVIFILFPNCIQSFKYPYIPVSSSIVSNLSIVFNQAVLNFKNYIFDSQTTQKPELSTWPTTQHVLKEEPLYFDYIVVGAGASGCPLAHTLAEAGYSTLLLERGPRRSEVPLTTTIDGAGVVINDQAISEKYITAQGIRTHVANVAGGGTSINLAIFIEEVEEYFIHLQNTYPNVKWDLQLVQQAFEWIRQYVGNDMPNNSAYGVAWSKGLASAGFEPNAKCNATAQESVYKSIFQNDDFWILPSEKLQPGYTWAGKSIFDSTSNFTRKSSDIFVDPAFNKDINPIVNEYLTFQDLSRVEKIEFSVEAKKKPKATCVWYTKMPKVGPTQKVGFFQSIYAVASNITRNVFQFFKSDNSSTLHKVCVKNDGEIILSAGAILSTTLLFKSGIGPMEQIRDLNIPLVYEHPMLGQQFSDRALIPVAVFFEGETPVKGYPARICQAIAAGVYGSNCHDFGIGKKSTECSFLTAEELSGGRISEGIIYSTRFIFPPEWRNTYLMNFVFSTLESCSNNEMAALQILNPICSLLQPMIQCFRKVAANYYFTAEPKSRGSIKMAADGTVSIDGAYMKDEQDLYDAIRGVSNIIRLINSPTYEGIMQKKSTSSCPSSIMNGFIDLFVSSYVASNISIPPETLKSLSENLWRAIPPKDRRLAKIVKNDMIVELKPNEIPELEELFNSKDFNVESSTKKQWAASYPPTLPDPDDPVEVAKYVLTFLTSIWHHAGTAPMGEVVDLNFRVIGIEGLSIVDASILNQITRMNPTATLLMLGRYAGLLKVNERKII